MTLVEIGIIAGIIVAVANIIFMWVSYDQFKFRKKGSLFVKFVSGNKRKGEKQDKLEKDPFYFYLENKSKDVVIENLKIKTSAILKNKDDQKIGTKKFDLNIDYINPSERIYAYLFRLGGFAKDKKFKRLFKEVERKKERGSFISPKEKLKIIIYIDLEWGKRFFKNNQKDYYEIDWEAFDEKCHNEKDHPLIFSFNKRGKFIVEKVEEINLN